MLPPVTGWKSSLQQGVLKLLRHKFFRVASTTALDSSRMSPLVLRTLLAPDLHVGEIEISGDEAHHGLRVLRLHVGDVVRVADGSGHEAVATVNFTGRHHLRVDVGTINLMSRSSMAELTVAVSPPKGDRWSDTIRALTELGVGCIRPLRCERGATMLPAEGSDLRNLRVATEALKQCRRGWLPELQAPIDIDSLACIASSNSANVIFGDLFGDRAYPSDPPWRTIIAIGPEGGLSDRERSLLIKSGAKAVRLASAVLRIETAAVSAAAIWSSSWEVSHNAIPDVVPVLR